MHLIVVAVLVMLSAAFLLSQYLSGVFAARDAGADATPDAEPSRGSLKAA